MEIKEAIHKRHSVRNYINKSIPDEIVMRLKDEITQCNKESGLHIKLVTDEPKAFDGFMAHYGKFKGVQNYIALVGEKSPDLDEKIGYYGERIVLLAQMLGLNTCWVAMTFSKGVTKNKCEINKGEKLVCVIALGYGANQGISHKIKEKSDVCKVQGLMPEWFNNGIEMALLAPTATNQQKFMFELESNSVCVKSTGGFYSKVDLGIVKYHFEVGAGRENFSWK